MSPPKPGVISRPPGRIRNPLRFGFSSLRPRATRLAELKQLGQKVYALSWTRSQRSAFWALGRARRHAGLADTERHLTQVRKAMQKI
jgi:hypothetical protein